ncbi:CBS domain-containing protein [Methanocorpusculum sp.]|nr:CBS domain-containing protein [Methanocorpusculum sp.]
MSTELKIFSICLDASIVDAMQKIDENKKGFLIVMDNEVVVGTLTDGDIRRAIINGHSPQSNISDIFVHDFTYVKSTDSFNHIIELFKDTKVKFIPIVDDEMRLCNVITKSNLHTLLLQDIPYDAFYPFNVLDDSLLEHEIYPRPWGYYKTTLLNKYCQCKIIRVNPHGVLSLQLHHKRDEQWIIVHGKGVVQIGDEIFEARPGYSFTIPRETIHRLRNSSDSESLIIAEVQMGEYFGEDDIIRIEDEYGRTNC